MSGWLGAFAVAGFFIYCGWSITEMLLLCVLVTLWNIAQTLTKERL
jgi:hypothetical protein